MIKAGLIAAGIAAVGSFALMHLYLRRLEAEVSGGPKISVLVATQDVAMGATLSDKVLAVRDVPQAYVESRHVRASDLRKVLGVRCSTGLKTNETLLWSDVAQLTDRARNLSSLIQQGMRAVALADHVDFDGLLQPGDRVDVVFTRTDTQAGSNSTTTLLQNVMVMSVRGELGAGDEQTKRGYGGAVILSATVEQAQILTEAQKHGHLTLTLRNPEDITLLESVTETTAKDLAIAKPRETVRGRIAQPNRETIEHVR